MRHRPCRSRLAAPCLLLFVFLSITAGTAAALTPGEAVVELTDAEAQAKTLADMRNVGTAMFSWLIDQVGDEAAAENRSVSLNLYPPIARVKLESLLVPQYIQSVPERDGWGNPYEFFLNRDNPLAQQVMGIRSPGRDGQSSGNSYTIGAFDPESYDEDIVWVDGFFARWPQKAATRETR